MDTLTHALSGVLVTRAARRGIDGRRLLVVGLAAAFPDLDYLLILIDPLGFLNLHRGPTHSLVLLPLWAAGLGLLLARFLDIGWRQCAALCALGLLVHIVGDWVTLYGTKLWYPLSDQAYALRASFDFNPWIAGLTLLAVLLGRRWRPQRSAQLWLLLVAGLLFGQYWLGATAAQRAAQQLGTTSAVQALPQPLSPFHWALVVRERGGYAMAYVDLLGLWPAAAAPHAWPARMLAVYRPLQQLTWTHHAGPNHTALSAEAWQQPQFAQFRRFARLPALLDMLHTPGEVCAWFTDLRHLLPGLPASFRYGLCRAADGGPWRAYRLRWFSADRRQAL